MCLSGSTTSNTYDQITTLLKEQFIPKEPVVSKIYRFQHAFQTAWDKWAEYMLIIMLFYCVCFFTGPYWMDVVTLVTDLCYG